MENVILTAPPFSAAKILWDFHCSSRNEAPFHDIDVIVGLGSYDITIVDRCVQLSGEHIQAQVIFTGKCGNWTAGLYSKTEAEHFRDLAVAKGVNPDRILVEAEAGNISENIIYAERLLAHKEFKVVYVTKPQTLMRLATTVRKVGSVKNCLFDAPERNIEEAIEIFGQEQIYSEMVGDLDRLLVYPSKGFSEKVEVEASVLKAGKALIDAGFTSHLLAAHESFFMSGEAPIT